MVDHCPAGPGSGYRHISIGDLEELEAKARKSGANWPQAFMVAAVFGSFAAIIWAIAWAVR